MLSLTLFGLIVNDNIQILFFFLFLKYTEFYLSKLGEGSKIVTAHRLSPNGAKMNYLQPCLSASTKFPVLKTANFELKII